jgi:hypothetical protein
MRKEASGTLSAAPIFTSGKRECNEFVRKVLEKGEKLWYPAQMLVRELQVVREPDAVLWILVLGIFTPVGWIFRIAGRDALSRRFRPEATTYWAPKQIPTDVRSYFGQF